MYEPIWRRFIPIGGEKKEKALLALVKQKGLTREDLMLILKSIKLRLANNGNQQEFIEIQKPYSGESVTITLPKCAKDEIPVLIRKPYSDKITVSVARKVFKGKEIITMFDDEYEFDESEFAPMKPLSPERKAEINDLYAQIAADLAEING